jgi:PD-(D/E)XK nuclease superfamily
LAEAGLVPEAFEQELTKTIPGGPEGLVIRARFDRVLTGNSARVVSDYKTGRHLASRIGSSAMLSGSALQVPIYALIANASVELLGVGRDNEPEVVVFEDFKNREQRDGVLETLRVAATLAVAGRFPIRPDDHCRNCDYRSACRRGHPPTEFREDHAEDVRDARDCWAKSVKTPSLAAVRGESRR